jgi:hypothetical protein
METAPAPAASPAARAAPAPAAPTVRCSRAGCSLPALAGVCGRCHSSRYCTPDHQKRAWKEGHKKWCGLIDTEIGEAGTGGPGPSLRFVGQSDELERHPNFSVTAALDAAEAARSKGGFVKAKGFKIGDDGGGDEPYVALAAPLDPEALAKLWPQQKPASKLAVPRRRLLLVLEYCIGTRPVFLATAPEGARGFTRAQVVSFVVRAYKWVYEKENEPYKEEGAPRASPMMLNRGYTNGPFQIGMHDLEDLLLHTVHVLGSWPSAAAAAAGSEGDEEDGGPITVVVSTLGGIDS